MVRFNVCFCSVKPDEELVGTQKDHPSSGKGLKNVSTKEHDSILINKEEVKKTTKKHVTFLQPRTDGKGDEKVSENWTIKKTFC